MTLCGSAPPVALLASAWRHVSCVPLGRGRVRWSVPLGARFPLVGLVCLVWLLAGCRATAPLLISSTGSPLAIDDARATRALEDYLDSIETRTGLRGSARVALSGPDFKLNRPQRIVVERPARLRFEVLGLFDQLAAILASDGRRFGYFDASTQQITRGWVSPTLLWDLVKVDLLPEEVVGLLLGAPEPSAGLARAAVWLEPDGRIAVAFAWPSEDPDAGCQFDLRRRLLDSTCFVEEAALREGGEVYFFDGGGQLSEQRSLDPDGVIRTRTLFESYAAIDGSGGVPFPNRVTIRSPGVESEARFEWKRVMLASGLSDRLFTLPDRRASGQGG